MNKEVYPGVLIQNLPTTVTKEEVLSLLRNLFGNDHSYGVKIYLPLAEDPYSTSAVLTGIRKPFGEIRKKLNRTYIGGKYLIVADVDFGLDRLIDATMEPRTLLLHTQFKKSYGELGTTNVFDKQWLEENMGGLVELDCFAVLEQSCGAEDLDIGQLENLIRVGKVSRQKAKAIGLEPETGNQNLMLEFLTSLDAIQSICLLNKSKHLSKKCFLGQNGKKIQTTRAWLGKNGKIDVDGRMKQFGYVPLDDFEPGILNVELIAGLKLPCLNCQRNLDIVGVDPSFTYFTGKCTCRNRESCALPRWPGEDFVRVLPSNPAQYIINGLKPNYGSVDEFARAGYTAACFEHLSANLYCFERFQSNGEVTHVHRKGRLGPHDNLTQIKVVVRPATPTWDALVSSRVDEFTVVLNPIPIRAPNGRIRCEFNALEGETRLTGLVKDVNKIAENETEIELVISLPPNVALTKMEAVYLIPRLSTRSLIGLRSAIREWRNYRTRMEENCRFVCGEIILPIIEMDQAKTPSSPADNQTGFVLFVKVEPLQIWNTMSERLRFEYVGAELDTEVETNGSQHSAFLLNARVVGLWEEKDQHILSLVVKVDKSIRFKRCSCFLWLWSLGHGEEKSTLDWEYDYKKELGLFDVFQKPFHQFHQKGDCSYISEFTTFCDPVHTDLSSIETTIKTIIPKPASTPSLFMMDIFLYAKRSLNHEVESKNWKLLDSTVCDKIPDELKTCHINRYQKKAIQKAMRHRLSLVVGTSGTGKTQTLSLLSITLSLTEKGAVFVAGSSDPSTGHLFEVLQEQKMDLGLDQLNILKLPSKNEKREILLDDLLDPELPERGMTQQQWELAEAVKASFKYGKGSLGQLAESVLRQFEIGVEEADLDKANIICFTMEDGTDWRLRALAERTLKRGKFVSALLVDDADLVTQTSLIATLGGMQVERLVLFADDGRRQDPQQNQTSSNANFHAPLHQLFKLSSWNGELCLPTRLFYQYRMSKEIFSIHEDWRGNTREIITYTHECVNQRIQPHEFDLLHSGLRELSDRNMAYYCFRRHGLGSMVTRGHKLILYIVRKLVNCGVSDIGIVSANNNLMHLTTIPTQACDTLPPGVCIGNPVDFEGKECSAIVLAIIDRRTKPSHIDKAVSSAKDILIVLSITDMYSTSNYREVRDFLEMMRSICGKITLDHLLC